jgi:hypothetical protein
MLKLDSTESPITPRFSGQEAILFTCVHQVFKT